jgi:diaminopimelate epimerase
MHGLGNDFIIIEDLGDSIVDRCRLAVKLCNRHFGIGADGVMFVKKSKCADIRMEIINSDGSIAEMCGNGVRCFARYVYDKKIINKEDINVETLAGIMKIHLKIQNNEVYAIRVDMGKPSFEKEKIPFSGSENNRYYHININDREFKTSTMLMGVPHTIIFTDCLNEDEVISKGKLIERMSIFPQRTNVNFVKVIDRKNIEVRTWERGAGYTLACGTGTCASVVSCIINGFTDNIVSAALAGGKLNIEFNGENVFMEGPAEYVFEGKVL